MSLMPEGSLYVTSDHVLENFTIATTASVNIYISAHGLLLLMCDHCKLIGRGEVCICIYCEALLPCLYQLLAGIRGQRAEWCEDHTCLLVWASPVTSLHLKS